jgi:hypothetical protein
MFDQYKWKKKNDMIVVILVHIKSKPFKMMARRKYVIHGWFHPCKLNIMHHVFFKIYNDIIFCLYISIVYFFTLVGIKHYSSHPMWLRKTLKPNHWSYQIDGQIQCIVKGLKTLGILFNFHWLGQKGHWELKNVIMW